MYLPIQRPCSLHFVPMIMDPMQHNQTQPRLASRTRCEAGGHQHEATSCLNQSHRPYWGFLPSVGTRVYPFCSVFCACPIVRSHSVQLPSGSGYRRCGMARRRRETRHGLITAIPTFRTPFRRPMNASHLEDPSRTSRFGHM